MFKKILTLITLVVILKSQFSYSTNDASYEFCVVGIVGLYNCFVYIVFSEMQNKLNVFKRSWASRLTIGLLFTTIK
jgi:hypothetical protein